MDINLERSVRSQTDRSRSQSDCRKRQKYEFGQEEKKNICYLPAGRSVLEKYFVEVSKTARDRRSRDVFETETKYFSVRTDLNGK